MKLTLEECLSIARSRGWEVTISAWVHIRNSDSLRLASGPTWQEAFTHALGCRVERLEVDDAWRLAVLDALGTECTSPQQAIEQLLKDVCREALDPNISEDAKELYRDGYLAGLVEGRKQERIEHESRSDVGHTASVAGAEG